MTTTRPDDLDTVQKAKIYGFLKEHPVGVLASVDANGDPSASVVYFGVTEDLHITFTTKRDTHKHENIQRHPVVTMAVYDAETQSAVQLSGNAVEATDDAEAQATFQDTLNAAQQTGPDNVPPIAKVHAGPYVAYRIIPNNIWMKEYGWGDAMTQALEHASDPAPTSDPA